MEEGTTTCNLKLEWSTISHIPYWKYGEHHSFNNCFHNVNKFELIHEKCIDRSWYHRKIDKKNDKISLCGPDTNNKNIKFISIE